MRSLTIVSRWHKTNARTYPPRKTAVCRTPVTSVGRSAILQPTFQRFMRMDATTVRLSSGVHAIAFGPELGAGTIDPTPKDGAFTASPILVPLDSEHGLT